MKNSKNVILILLFYLLIYTNKVIAQKLPSIQQNSSFAPSDVKIDGKNTEWGDKLEAYNKDTELFYTISNNDEDLFLVIQISNPRVIQKVLYAGIDFIANTTGKKNYKEAENISIHFPLLDESYVSDIARKAGDKSHWGGLPPGPTQLVGPDVLTRTDSTVLLANKRLTELGKTIIIHGINTIPDTLISIYNEYGIKVAISFNNMGNYVYELEIPLKYLNKPINKAQKITYSIKLNGFYTSGNFTDRVTKITMPIDPDIATETKFWADYILAKK